MSPRKVASSKKKPVDGASGFGRGVLQRTTTSVASIKEKTKQGLKRLASKGSLRKRGKGSTNTGGSSSENTGRSLASTSQKVANSGRSPAVKVFRPRSDENTPQRQQPSRRVKTCKGPKQTHDSELERRRVPVSISSALQEMKGNISKAVETVSTKLRINRTGGRSRFRQSSYDPLLSAETPVKLYSPFAIGEFEHTPTGVESAGRGGGRVARSRVSAASSRTTPRNQHGKVPELRQRSTNVSRNLLDTPSGKFRQDLEDMTRGFEELTSLTKRLRDNAQQEKI